MTPAIRFLKHIGSEFKVHTYECHISDDFGKHCAKQLQVEENKVFKTLLIHHDKQAVTAIVPVNKRLNLKASAKLAHLKQVELMAPADAERITGYKVGVISKNKKKKALPTLLDESALAYASILVSGGKRGVSIEIAPQALIHLLNASVAIIGE